MQVHEILNEMSMDELDDLIDQTQNQLDDAKTVDQTLTHRIQLKQLQKEKERRLLQKERVQS